MFRASTSLSLPVALLGLSIATPVAAQTAEPGGADVAMVCRTSVGLDRSDCQRRFPAGDSPPFAHAILVMPVGTVIIISEARGGSIAADGREIQPGTPSAHRPAFTRPIVAR